MVPAAVLALTIVAPALLEGGARKLNDPLPRAPGGDVREARYTPDGARLVFRADAEQDEVVELFSAPAAGGGPRVKLNAPLPPGNEVEQGFLLTPDGARVLFLVRASGFASVGELHVAPVDGSAPATLLAPSVVLFRPVRLAHDGAHVLYLDGVRLMAAAIDGGAPPFELGPLAPGRAVAAYDVSPVTGRVAYLANRDDPATFELYAVDLVPAATPLRLSAPLVAGGEVTGHGSYEGAFRISPDGGTVVYRADQLEDDAFELFSVPLAGGTPVRVSHANLALAGMDAFAFAIDAASTRVVFDVGPNGFTNSLASAPLDGSAAPIDLSFSVQGFELDPTGARVVYRTGTSLFSNRRDLHSVALDGSAPVFLGVGDIVSFAIDPTGTRVAFEAYDQQGGSGTSLRSTPIDTNAGTFVVPLEPFGSTPEYRFSPDGQHLLYRHDLDVFGRLELYSVPAAGGMPIRLNAPLPAGGHVDGFDVRPDSAAVSLRADLSVATVIEAFHAPIGGGANVRQSDDLPDNALLGGVIAFQARNRSALYLAHAGNPSEGQLFATSYRGNARARLLTPSQNVGFNSFQVSPDGSQAVYLTTNTGTAGDVELFSVRTDGSTAPVRLGRGLSSGTAVFAYRISPAGSAVGFLSDRRFEGLRELYLAPIDGAFPATRWSGTLAPGGEVLDFHLPSSGTRLVYRAEGTSVDVFELYSRAAGAPPARLDGPLVAGGDVLSYQVSPDESFVVYLADQASDEVFELFRVPTDGSAPAVRLNAPLVAGGDVREYHLSADGARVVYLADQLANDRDELFSVPSDASAPAVRLNGTLPSGGDVLAGLRLSANGLVVYRASTPGGLDPGLFAAPLDGSAPALLLVQPMSPFGSVSFFRLTPDGGHAVFLGDFFHHHVYGVPTDGSAGPLQLDDFPPTAVMVTNFLVTPDGMGIVLRAGPKGDERLYLGNIDGRPSFELGPALGPQGSIGADAQVTPDGHAVLFRAEDQDPDAFELFLRVIDGRLSGADAPR
ncbi:MAG TPA: hypothetical protein VF530_10370 [Planctomycetota bacterium]